MGDSFTQGLLIGAIGGTTIGVVAALCCCLMIFHATSRMVRQLVRQNPVSPPVTVQCPPTAPGLRPVRFSSGSDETTGKLVEQWRKTHGLQDTPTQPYSVIGQNGSS